jgi:hypothetical protein
MYITVPRLRDSDPVSFFPDFSFACALVSSAYSRQPQRTRRRTEPPNGLRLLRPSLLYTHSLLDPLISFSAHLHAPPALHHPRTKSSKTSTWYFRVDSSSTTGNPQASHTCALANLPSLCYFFMTAYDDIFVPCQLFCRLCYCLQRRACTAFP